MLPSGRTPTEHVASLMSMSLRFIPTTRLGVRAPCAIYRRRWDIEVFFKQVKQSLKLGSFPGHSANAVRWQGYTALLVYVPLRFMAHCAQPMGRQ